MRDASRRRVIRSLGAATVGASLAGCVGGGSGPGGDSTPEGDVLVGPGGRNAFDPEAYTVSVGETVTWTFESPGHNVSGVPAHSPRTGIPDGADPFASYGADGDPNETETQGATYERAFETPGEYTYVCVPHVRQGMVGTVVVEK